MEKQSFGWKWKMALAAGVLACSAAAQAQMAVTSPAFANGGVIPNPFAYSVPGQCSGNNWSPPLEITGIPAGTQTLVIMMEDTTVPWLHWEAWDIAVPAGQTSLSLPYNVAASMPAGTQAANSWGTNGYAGACPPSGTGTHNYVFTVYALATAAGGGQPSAAALGAALDTATLSGLRTYGDNVGWVPPGGGGGGTATSVPTLSELSLAFTGLLLAAMAFFTLRRKA